MLASHLIVRAARGTLVALLLALGTASAQTQTAAGPGSKDSEQTGTGTPASTAPADGKQGDSKTGGRVETLAAIAPSAPPPKLIARPRIGVALGGGAALAMSEIGALEWFEEHHIPVDVIAGTSMGCMVSALYSTGKTTDQLKTVMTDKVFNSVFSFSNSYASRSFRRREDSRELPNGLTVGLRHGVSFRNALLVDQGLDAFLDRQFLRWNDKTDFNDLPIPLRCIATDLNTAEPATFARGSIPDAVRASVSLPGVYQPFKLGGQEFVDGGVLENLPTQTVHDMNADVVIAVSLPLTPVQKGDLDSILGVLERSASVFIESRERQERKLANVVVMPDVQGFNASDYLKAPELARRGYAAAEAKKAALLPYAVNDEQWEEYLAFRRARLRPQAGPVLSVQVKAPNVQVTRVVQELFAPLVNQPVDTQKIEALLDEVRADGRYDADYTVGYETSQPPPPQPAPAAATAHKPQERPAGAALQNPDGDGHSATPLTAEALANIPARPIIVVDVSNKATGPPFLQVGINIEGQPGAVTRTTVEGILVDQDLGGYGSELRSDFKLGYLTELSTEYFKPVNFLSNTRRAIYVQPRADLLRQPFSIYVNQVRLADRRLERIGAGGDIGWTNRRTANLSAGLEYDYVDWTTLVGSDGAPAISGTAQRARLQYTFDNQDRALVPQFGLHLTTEAAFLYDAVQSPNDPQVYAQLSFARTRRYANGTTGKNSMFFYTEGGSMFHRGVAQPFRFTLGGPQRLSASAIDEYRGTDYFLVEPALLRRIASLPQPLGQNVYLGLAYEAGQMYAPGARTVTRQDVYFGVLAETPLGVITLAPAIGDDGHRKFVFTLGKLF